MSKKINEWECWNCDYLVESEDVPSNCPNCFQHEFRLLKRKG